MTCVVVVVVVDVYCWLGPTEGSWLYTKAI